MSDKLATVTSALPAQVLVGDSAALYTTFADMERTAFAEVTYQLSVSYAPKKKD